MDGLVGYSGFVGEVDENGEEKLGQEEDAEGGGSVRSGRGREE